MLRTTLVYFLCAAATAPCSEAYGVMGEESADFDAWDNSVSIDEPVTTVDAAVHLIATRAKIHMHFMIDSASLMRLGIAPDRTFPLKVNDVSAADAICVVLMRVNSERKLCVVVSNVLRNGKRVIVIEEYTGTTEQNDNLVIGPSQLQRFIDENPGYK